MIRPIENTGCTTGLFSWWSGDSSVVMVPGEIWNASVDDRVFITLKKSRKLKINIVLNSVLKNMESTVKKLILDKLRKRRTLDSSDSTSSSDEDEFVIKISSKVESKRHRKIENFVNEIVLQYSSKDFQNHFRLTKIKFEVSFGLIINAQEKFVLRS